MNGFSIKECLCCGGNNLRMALDLGVQPPANSYTLNPDEEVSQFPLALNICTNCWNAQLSFCVDRKEIFDHYAYVSGTSKTLTKFFAWFAKALSKAMPTGGRVMELACNDGSLIREMQNVGLDCIGVDPAANIAKQAQEAGLPVVCGYWPQVANKIDGKFDVMVCMNVVAHVDDPLTFLVGCRDKLTPGGTIMVQPSQARMFAQGEFDTMYHEHISFFNTRSMAKLAARAGLKLVVSFLVKIHGDSAVYLLQHADATPVVGFRDPFMEGEFAINEDLVAYEKAIKLFDWSTYEQFGRSAREIVSNVVNIVAEQRALGRKIVFVGAAAKAMTLVNAGSIKPDLFIDENPLKIGLHAPGSGTQIVALQACGELVGETFFVFSAWNFRHELAAKVRDAGVPHGSVFYSYFPAAEFL